MFILMLNEMDVVVLLLGEKRREFFLTSMLRWSRIGLLGRGRDAVLGLLAYLVCNGLWIIIYIKNYYKKKVFNYINEPNNSIQQ